MDVKLMHKLVSEYWQVLKMPSSTETEIYEQQKAMNGLALHYDEPYRTMVVEWFISYEKCMDRLEAKDGI